MRLDKLLANAGVGSRKDVKNLLKKRKVTVNDVVIKDGGMQIEASTDEVVVSGETIQYQTNYYIMLHKPKGVVSATTDKHDRTVIDLVKRDYAHVDLFPVGRLDKDTEGLLLLTNDGDLGHRLTSPKKKVKKLYYAVIEGRVTKADSDAFQMGVILDDGYQTRPASLEILTSGETSEVQVTITEGKFHQVKRMFIARDKRVCYLKRLQMGGLKLDEQLAPGDYRQLTTDECVAYLS